MAKNRSWLATALMCLILSLCSNYSYARNLVLDGDFRSANGIRTFQTFGSGQRFGAWDVTYGSVDLIGGYWQAPAPGQGSVDLDGSSPGEISQMLNTQAGKYTLTFALAGNPEGGTATKIVRVQVGDTVKDFAFDVSRQNPGFMGYANVSLVFYTDGPTELIFTSMGEENGGTAYGPVIGNVSVYKYRGRR
jgi:choice-of-anchor C domain-containing protein